VTLALACLVGFGLAAAAGARPTQLLDVQLRWTGLIVIALALQLALFAFHLTPPAPWTVEQAHLASYLLLAVFGLRNARTPGLALAVGGLLSNAIVIFANGGRMPVSQAAYAESYGKALAGIHGNIVAATASSHLTFLADIFALPRGVPFSNTFSVGDVMLVAGAILFVYSNGRAPADKPSAQAFEPLRVRAFRALMAARMFSKLGDWVSTAALVTWIYQNSHSTVGVSGILLARITASVAGSLTSGVVLRNRDRFGVLAAVEGARGAATLAALAAVAANLPVAVAGCVFLSAFLASATDPTASSVVADVLPRESRHAGNALHALGRAVVMAVGSVGGGVLAATIGIIPALLVDTSTFAIALVFYATPLLRTATTVPRREENGAPDPAGSSATGRFEAFREVCRRRQLAGLVASFTAATFAMGVLNASLPAFLAARASNVGGYGVGMGAIAAGLICGEYLSGRVGSRIVERIPTLGFAVAAAVMAIEAKSHTATTIILLLFALGVSDGTTETAYDSIVQSEAPTRMVDRVFAVAGAVQQSGMVVGFVVAALLQHTLPGTALRITSLSLVAAAGLGLLAIGGHRREDEVDSVLAASEPISPGRIPVVIPSVAADWGECAWTAADIRFRIT
jgi:MFS family permease